jgi:hypothetical protein
MVWPLLTTSFPFQVVYTEKADQNGLMRIHFVCRYNISQQALPFICFIISACCLIQRKHSGWRGEKSTRY